MVKAIKDNTNNYKGDYDVIEWHSYDKNKSKPDD